MEYEKGCKCRSTSRAGELAIGSAFKNNLKIAWKMKNPPVPRCDTCKKAWKVVAKDKTKAEPGQEDE